MTAKLSIKCPYQTETDGIRHRVLMFVYFRETDDEGKLQDAARISNKKRIQRIRAVEIFSELLDAEDEKDTKKVSETESLFLVTCEKEEQDASSIKLESADADDLKNWQVHLYDKSGEKVIAEIKFRAALSLKTRSRCSLLPSDEDGVRLDFEFAKSGGALTYQNRLNCLKKLSSNYDGLEFESATPSPLDGIFNRIEKVTEKPTVLPRVLRFDHFAPGADGSRKPNGSSFWEVEISKVADAAGETNSKKYGINVRFQKKKAANGDWWGNEEENATKLYPLNIAPVGVFKGENFDFEMRLAYPSQKLDEWILKKTEGEVIAEWKMKVNSIYDLSFKNNRSFTPLAAWNRFVAAQHYKSLKTVKDGNPGSVAPHFFPETYDFKAGVKSRVWTLSYDVTDLKPFDDDDLEKEQFAFALRDVGIKRDDETAEIQPLMIEAELRNFLDREGQSVRRKFLLFELFTTSACRVKEPEVRNAISDKPLFKLGIKDVVTETAVQEKFSRVGALNLHFTEIWKKPATATDPKEPFPHDFQGTLTASLRGLEELRFADSRNLIDKLEDAILHFCKPSIEAEIPLLLFGLSPGGQDPLPQEIADKNERFPETVIIPISDSEASAAAAGVKENAGFIAGLFALVANEKSRAQENQSLALRLEKVNKTLSNENNPLISFIVIDQHPSLITKVRAKISFADEVGNWDDAESFWELADEGESFELILPPQVVGEEFIKDYENFPNPNSAADPNKPFRLRYKFSPPAVFNLLRSNERQNFTEAPWNIRRLLGYIKGKERGAGVEQLEYELLFGLTTTVKDDFLRLAELNARLGHLPPLLKEKPPLRIEGFIEQPQDKICDEFLVEYDDLRLRFSEQKSLLQSRLALLYPFSVAQKARFLTLDKGVSFRFRTTREVVHPIDPTIDSTNNTSVPPGFLPLDKGGLRGGVDQGFESRNIHTEVIDSKTSSSGKIIAPSFTALGGSGYQKASFALDKSTIYSNTFLGRTFFYSLERIGRIGVLWNRAKHVIVYERTVADTQQFDDEKGIWRGIPAVRKVAEYVEILQPERNYPEFGEAPKVRGFVLGSKFEPEARIAVDSKWGRDIQGGWVVPLHNPAAAKPGKSTVYPKPNIHLKIATAEETGKAQTWGRITNPEDLYFYTSTNPKDDDDTDEWAAVPEIDYPLENVPKAPTPEQIGTHVGGAMDAMLPDPPRTEGGYAPFTFNLDTNKHTADLLTDRLKSSVEAVIENVSLARRKLEIIQFDGQSKKIRDAIEIPTQDYRTQVEAEIGNTLKVFSDNNIVNLSSQIDGLKNRIQTKIDNAQNEYRKAELNTLQTFQKAQADLQKNWENAWAETRKKVSEGIRGIDSEANDAVGKARELLFDLRRQLAAAEFALQETRMKLQKTLNEIKKFEDDFSNKVSEFKNRLKFEVEKIIADKNIEASLKKNRAIAAAITEFARWQKLLSELRSKTEGLIPDFWQDVDNMIDALAQKLTTPDLAAVDAWLDDIGGSLENYKTVWLKKLREKIEGFQTAIDTNADLRALEKVIADEVKIIEELEKTLDKVSLANFQKNLETELDKIKGKISTDFFGKANNILNNLTGTINQIHGEIDNLANKSRQEVERAANIAKSVAQKLEQNISDETRRALQTATEALMGNATKILAPFEKKLRDEVRRIDLSGDLEKAKAVGERTLRLVRAYGEAPIAQAMKLNRERLAYYYGELDERAAELKNLVAYTPATVLMNRVGRELENLDLKTLGIRLPSKELVEKFVADNLPKFDLKDILPDFAGMKLEKFFSGVKIPQGVKDAVNVAHGIDKQTGRAWAKCDVVMPLGKPISLFNFGAVEVRLVKAHFEAHTSMSADLMNPDRIEKHAEGAITADWHLLILGQVVLTLEKSTLRFDKNGKLKFEMQPTSIKLAAALQFVSDLVRSFNPGKKSGLSFELVTQGMLPVGARAVLNLPLPPLQTGAFAVSHLALRSRFEVAAPSGKFYVGVGLSLSSKERPFTLTVLCLGGGGWLDVLTMYRPFEESGKLQTRLSIGLAAGADFTFDIGVAAGTVYFLISLYAEYTVGGGNSSLRIALRLSMGGEVSILGIVSVNLSLVLEASYESGGTLKCRGELSVSIEICWCFTLEVHQEVEFVLAGGGGGGSAGSLNAMSAADELNQVENAVSDAVSDYVNSYGE